ncbi:MAG: ribbon-helix-helix domain-containing protein [Desulfurococcales archaeon]|nr:ribbon-helix-helix domain-containing protein [Desulfurococcales archaeon]
MSVTVSIKVSKELVELADKMVKYGIARSRSHAFNIMIEKGIDQIRKEVEFWDSVYRKVEELEQKDYRIKHGGLSKLLEEGRSR